MKLAVVSLPLLFIFTSCATIVRGTKDRLEVLSEPTGADVKLSSGETGVTPASFKLKRTEDVDVTVSKAGYLPQTVHVESNFSGGGGTAMVGSMVAFGVIGVGIDAATGASKSLMPNPVQVTLQPEPKAPAKRRR